MSEFDHPVVAGLYDVLDPDRTDLELYRGVLRDAGARSVLDVGAGTGTFALLLAADGIEVTAVEPAGEMLAVARAKPGADAVRWIHGDATVLRDVAVDAATMTANTAQVFLDDESWSATLDAVRSALRPGGLLVFEVRRPAGRAWEGWNRESTDGITEVPGLGPVESWVEVDDVALPLVTFSNVIRLPDGETVVTPSTLRFRERDEIEQSLTAARFEVTDVLDAPDRPGREWVFVARAV